MENNFPKIVPDALLPITVCGREMTADIAWYPQAEYQGKVIYFCTEYCLEAFIADPDRFVNAHSRKKNNST